MNHPLKPIGPLNLLTDLPSQLAEERVEILVEHPGLRIERIVSTGQASPPGFWYQQPEHEFVLLLQGTFREGQTILADFDGQGLAFTGQTALQPAAA